MKKKIKAIFTKKSNDRSDVSIDKSQTLASEDYENRLSPTFVVGTGRCGTHFYYELMKLDPSIFSIHESLMNQEVDSFRRYCIWNNLNVDNSVFFAYRRHQMNKMANVGRAYFEANTYLSLSSLELYKEFNANLILGLRNPVKTVKSICKKGWYSKDFYREDVSKPMGYQGVYRRTNHMFGRIVPNGDEYNRWQELSQVGKASWFWNALNLAVLRQFEEIPENKKSIIKIEEFSYDEYVKLHQLVGGENLSSESGFSHLVLNKPSKSKYEKNEWTDKEKNEFLDETHVSRKILGYEDIEF